MDKVEAIMNRWNALQPLSDRDRELLSRRFTIDFNYNSNHIEGNTLTYGQTEILLLFGKVVGEAEVKDVQEMTASNVGLKMMTEEAGLKDIPLRTSSGLCTRPSCEKTTRYTAIYPAGRPAVMSFTPANTRHAQTVSSHVTETVLSMRRRKRHLH